MGRGSRFARKRTILSAIERTEQRLEFIRRGVVPVNFSRDETKHHEEQILVELQRVLVARGGAR